MEPTHPPKLLDRLREAIRTRRYSRKTEKAYVHWVRRYIVFHGKRHPAEMGEAEIARFLTSLATGRRVSASTQNQALNALFCFSIGTSFRGKSGTWTEWSGRKGPRGYRSS